MKKPLRIILGIFLLVAILFILQSAVKQKVRDDFKTANPSNVSVSPTPFQKISPSQKEQTSVFVPYWTLGDSVTGDEDRFIYFGIAADRSGINENDEGFRKLGQFRTKFGDAETYLTIRMLDQETNFDIVESKNLQEALISQSLDIAREYGFDGIVLDLELKALPFESVVKDINGFVSRFYEATKDQDVRFSVAIYGDTFYRVRPFDVKHIAKNSDEIMIMAYDFHKSGGNPGPNFPLKGSESYGYDYYEMMDDFLGVVPPEKLTVIFGMFGYNWKVDEKNVSLASGEALSTLQIQSRYVTSCGQDECNWKRDDASGEIKVTYKNKENQYIVWFEDEESVEKKKAFLKDRGINSFSYWAYSYY